MRLRGRSPTPQWQSTTNANAAAQWASVEALDGPQDFIPKHNQVFKERRDLCVAMLNQSKEAQVPEAGGGVLPINRPLGDAPNSS